MGRAFINHKGRSRPGTIEMGNMAIVFLLRIPRWSAGHHDTFRNTILIETDIRNFYPVIPFRFGFSRSRNIDSDKVTFLRFAVNRIAFAVMEFKFCKRLSTVAFPFIDLKKSFLQYFKFQGNKCLVKLFPAFSIMKTTGFLWGTPLICFGFIQSVLYKLIKTEKIIL